MDSKEVEDLFKGVLTDESQDSHESVLPETVPSSVSSSSYSFSHSNLNATAPVVNNQQQGVIITQGPPPIMSPSHSGKLFYVLTSAAVLLTREISVVPMVFSVSMFCVNVVWQGNRFF